MRAEPWKIETSNQEVDLKATARIAQIVGLSLVAWAGEAFLVFYLLSARTVPRGACFGIIRDILGTTYVALAVIEITLILPWKL